MGWSTIPKVITGVKALSKTGAESVAAWKSKAAKSKLKKQIQNLAWKIQKLISRNLK